MNRQSSSRITRLRWRVAAGVAVLSLLVSGPITTARPENTQEYYYFTGCGSELTQVGNAIIDCEGHHTSWGTREGIKWMVYLAEPCSNCGSEFCESAAEFYEWCPNTGWKTVSSSDFFAGNCSC